MYLTGPDSQEAADWLFTANVDRVPNRVVYTCALNAKGGIEADVRVIKLQQGLGTLVGPILKVISARNLEGSLLNLRILRGLVSTLLEVVLRGIKQCVT